MDSTIDTGNEWIDSAAACALLEVKRATLYSYVSRGMVRRVPAPPPARGRLYHRGDVQRLIARRDARRGHGAVAAGALRWGEAVLETAIGEVTPAGPSYRGALATTLIGTPFRDVAARLIGVDALPRANLGEDEARDLGRRALGLIRAGAAPFESQRATLASCLGLDERPSPAASAAFFLRVFAAAPALASAGPPPQRLERFVRGAAGRRSLPRTFLEALSVPTSKARVEATNAALVLIAEHELNASSFAARVAGGAGARVADILGAASGAFAGTRHGAATGEVVALLESLPTPEAALRLVREARDAHRDLPGFGHRLYPRGDPRAKPLLDRARALAPRADIIRKANALLDALALARGDAEAAPSVDFALVVLAGALGRADAAMALFALGRTAGWIAHGLEQRDAGHLLRPRARYSGPPTSE